MRAAFISHDSAAGGAERALLELIDGLLERGVTCSVVLRKRGWLAEELHRRGVTFAFIPYRGWISVRPRGRLLNLFALVMVLPVLAQLRRWGVDVVLTNTSVIPVGALAAFLLRKPHIWHIHEFCKKEYGSTFDLGTRLTIKMIGRLSAFVIVNSKAIAAYYAQFIPQHQIRMIYQAVNVQARCGADKVLKPLGRLGSVKLVLVGAIQEGKGQTDAVQALAQLIGQGVQAELNLVGTGNASDLERVESAIARCGLEQRVKFTGCVPDASPFVEESDIALMCSQSEAFGRSTVEAMKLGKPVVGARGGATPELIRENFNGLLYTPGDYLDLAQKVKFLIDNPEAARQMGENGRRWSQEQFTVEKYAGKVLQVLEETIRWNCRSAS
jgi:glycosyltransferase involved in cell wall biosynthesis